MSAEPVRHRPGSLPVLSEQGRAELRQLQDKIRRERGFQCAVYKDKCLLRRLMVRMRARGSRSFAAYADLLDRDAGEYDLLIDTLTVNVTKFFRNATAWDSLRRHVVPALFASPGSRRRIWSAGCSSGEEPYSVAILLHEWARQQGLPEPTRGFAIEGTDIDHASLLRARDGTFSPHSLAETPGPLREAWFSPGPPYRLRDEARRMVSFRRHDLVFDDPPAGCRLILCRNVLIYFEREVQALLFQRFHDALLPGGFLVLGKAETLHGVARDGFEVVDGRERIFRKPDA